mmetsp:Transcript_22082/g.56398  ORF Transcript_22082/g.56398 Transcript_22082/m.56398 type:complete len:274 (-) Transcript_22082:383-1204(-)
MEFVSASGGHEGTSGRDASAGPKPRVPVAFGQFEIGRTSKPWVRNQPSPWSLDEMPQSVPLARTGDPGAYDPFAYGFMSDDARRTGYNQSRPPFDSSQVREFIFRTFLGGESGNLTYDAGLAQKKLYPTVDANVSVFRSRTTQRPSARSPVPGPAHYAPNLRSVEANPANAGAQMRSANGRFANYQAGMQGQKSATELSVGPGTYSTEYGRSLEADARRTLLRSSKIRPGFGSTTPQRTQFHRPLSPGPGTYQRLEPRVKDLKRASTAGHARI